MQKGFAPILIIISIIVIALIGGGAYYLGTQKAKTLPGTPAPVSIVQPSVDETASWKTYTNTKYGYSLKYPDSLGKAECSDKSTTENALILDPKFIDNPSAPCNTDMIPLIAFNLVDEESFPQNFKISKEEDIKVGGKDATKYTITKAGGEAFGPDDYIRVVVPLNNKVLIGELFDIKSESTFDRVLSTFKFIDQADDTSVWKTVSNKNGFSISYPPTMQISGVGLIGYAGSDPIKGIGINIGSEDVTEGKPNLHVYVIDTINDNRYRGKSLEQIALNNYNENLRNTNLYKRTIENLHETSFLNQKSYEYKIESKGFISTLDSWLGYEGIYRVIFTQFNNKFFLIELTENPEFNKILATFKFN